ncbi:carbohydrate ABC transporter permease [Streptomyces montanus]|uniref:Carbohydrate ABC transporter permease n=1 Tax=Streptomyces montanus TaxID=2580423 RepID=A0A5R9FRC7_9ACTN|nr:carbohydrate ABC transporter permease [Streptomyces montanus]TLS45229.1 carbohydrate ABC transporter permease [Streptomyces montanus]
MTGQLHVAEHSAAVRAPVPDARRAGRDRRRRAAAWRRTGFGLLVTAIVTISLFPFLWILRTSLMSSQEFAQGVTGFLPKHFTLSSYADNLSDQNFLRPLLNSILICLVSTALSVVCATLAGYALSRLRVRGAGVVLGFVLFAGFFPVLAMVGPLFLVYRELQLLDSPAGLVLAYMVYTLPIATWLLKSFFDQVPRSLEEAAMVDGASRLQVLWRIVVPVAMPAVFTSAIISFILAWNDFAFATSFLQTPERFTAPLAIVNLGQSQFQVFYNRIDAAVVLITLPVVLLVLFAQRRIVSGLTAGAVK